MPISDLFVNAFWVNELTTKNPRFHLHNAHPLAPGVKEYGRIKQEGSFVSIPISTRDIAFIPTNTGPGGQLYALQCGFYNTVDWDFGPATERWGRVTHYSISSDDHPVLWFHPIRVALPVVKINDPFKIPAYAISVIYRSYY